MENSYRLTNKKNASEVTKLSQIMMDAEPLRRKYGKHN